jgi:hypothetical protein
MAEVIQFNCPVCGTTLRLPLAMAAERGPCPHCTREIVAPDPASCIGAHEAPLPPPPTVIEPFRPFDEPPVAKVEVEAIVEPACEKPQLTVKPQRAVLVLSCLLTGVVTLALGFVLGMQANRRSVQVQPAKPMQTVIPSEPKPPVPDPIPIRVKPIIDDVPVEPPKIEAKPEPTQVAAAAEAALRAFLEAPDWAGRSAYALFPEKTRAAMEAYSREVSDGPTAFNSITVKQTQIDEITGYTLFIFFVSTETFPSGIPVAVQETPGGWLVDWQTFVEFRDQLFPKFADGPADQTGRFHLIVSQPPPERVANPENEHFESVVLNAPLSLTPHPAFVKKASAAFATLQAATAGGGFFTPVLEVAKRKTPDGKTYLEVLRVVASNWSPREP